MIQFKIGERLNITLEDDNKFKMLITRTIDNNIVGVMGNDKGNVFNVSINCDNNTLRQLKTFNSVGQKIKSISLIKLDNNYLRSTIKAV